MGTGHFTQVVWKGSTVLGIGIAEKGGCVYMVGRYKPPGNYQGAFAENVREGDFDKRVDCKSLGTKSFTEEDTPDVRNGTIQHPLRPVFERLNSKTKKKTFVGTRHH